MLEAQGTFPRASISYSDLVQFPNQFAKLFFLRPPPCAFLMPQRLVIQGHK